MGWEDTESYLEIGKLGTGEAGEDSPSRAGTVMLAGRVSAYIGAGVLTRLGSSQARC